MSRLLTRLRHALATASLLHVTAPQQVSAQTTPTWTGWRDLGDNAPDWGVCRYLEDYDGAKTVDMAALLSAFGNDLLTATTTYDGATPTCADLLTESKTWTDGSKNVIELIRELFHVVGPSSAPSGFDDSNLCSSVMKNTIESTPGSASMMKLLGKGGLSSCCTKRAPVTLAGRTEGHPDSGLYGTKCFDSPCKDSQNWQGRNKLIPAIGSTTCYQLDTAVLGAVTGYSVNPDGSSTGAISPMKLAGEPFGRNHGMVENGWEQFSSSDNGIPAACSATSSSFTNPAGSALFFTAAGVKPLLPFLGECCGGLQNTKCFPSTGWNVCKLDADYDATVTPRDPKGSSIGTSCGALTAYIMGGHAGAGFLDWGAVAKTDPTSTACTAFRSRPAVDGTPMTQVLAMLAQCCKKADGSPNTPTLLRPFGDVSRIRCMPGSDNLSSANVCSDPSHFNAAGTFKTDKDPSTSAVPCEWGARYILGVAPDPSVMSWADFDNNTPKLSAAIAKLGNSCNSTAVDATVDYTFSEFQEVVGTACCGGAAKVRDFGSCPTADDMDGAAGRFGFRGVGLTLLLALVAAVFLG